MSDLAKYVKPKKSGTITSINLTAKQMSFLKKFNLNLSMLVREWLDKLIKENENERKSV